MLLLLLACWGGRAKVTFVVPEHLWRGAKLRARRR